MTTIILGILLVLAGIERYLLIRRYEQERVSEATRAAQERSELVARVQGLTWIPRPSETPNKELTEDEDENMGLVGRVVYDEQ